jgi:hypothetical protein
MVDSSRISFIISYLTSLHYTIIAVFLLAHIFGLIAIPPLYFNLLVFYVAISLLSFPKAKQRFITPRVVNPKCSICGGNLVASQLICENCGATVDVKA